MSQNFWVSRKLFRDGTGLEVVSDECDAGTYFLLVKN